MLNSHRDIERELSKCFIFTHKNILVAHTRRDARIGQKLLTGEWLFLRNVANLRCSLCCPSLPPPHSEAGVNGLGSVAKLTETLFPNQVR